MLMKIFKLMWYIFNNFPIFFIDASFSSIVSSKKKKVERNWKWASKLAGDFERQNLFGTIGKYNGTMVTETHICEDFP